MGNNQLTGVDDMKKLEISLLIGILVAIGLCNFNLFTEEYQNLQKDVVRLHILANSDTEEDQALKLKVRDRILSESGYLFEDSKSVKETECIISENIGTFTEIAENVIESEGYDYGVKCELTNMHFDERVYEKYTLPSGNYDALRITIGKAEGKNWWCVMYPPLCLPAAMNEEELNEVLSNEEIDIIKNPQKYKIKFKCVEWYQKIKEKLEKYYEDNNILEKNEKQAVDNK